MSSIEDRWYQEREDDGGKLVKMPTDRNGVGQRWRAHYRDPGGKQHAKSFTRKTDAEKFLTGIDQSKIVGNFIDAARGRAAVGTLADDWLAARADLRPTTVARYVQAIDTHIRPRWGSVQVSEVDHEAVQAWLAELQRAGQKPGSVRKIATVFSGIMSSAVRGKRIASSPTVGVKLPRSQPGAHIYLTPAELEAMADVAGRYRLAVLVLGYAGLRWSELAGLQVGDLDTARSRLSIARGMVELNGGKAIVGPVKDYEARSVPLPPSIAAELAKATKGREPTDPMFAAERGGPLRNRSARRGWFDKAAANIGHPDLTPHAMRHVAASLAIGSGANVLAVSRMLGHADPSVTLRVYGHLWDDDLDALGKRLDAGRAAVVSRAFPKAKSRGSRSAAPTASRSRKR